MIEQSLVSWNLTEFKSHHIFIKKYFEKTPNFCKKEQGGGGGGEIKDISVLFLLRHCLREVTHEKSVFF